MRRVGVWVVDSPSPTEPAVMSWRARARAGDGRQVQAAREQSCYANHSTLCVVHVPRAVDTADTAQCMAWHGMAAQHRAVQAAGQAAVSYGNVGVCVSVCACMFELGRSANPQKLG